MGRNSKRNKAITKMYLPRLKKYCEQLEAQLEAMKTDPNTTLGQVINQARELYTQNSRLSVLTAALLESLGNKVTVSKAAMDKFENHRILIKWELPEGVEKAEDATEYIFLYEAVKNEQPQPIQVGPRPHTTESGLGGELLTPEITAASVQGSEPAVDAPDATVENGFLQNVDPTTFHGDPSGYVDSAAPDGEISPEEEEPLSHI